MIVDAHLDVGWNAIAEGRGFLGPPAPRYLISRSALTSAGVGLICATLYTAPARARRAMRTRFVYEDAHEAYIMAVAEVNYYRSCGLHLIRDSGELDAYVRNWKRGQVAAVLLMEGADPIREPVAAATVSVSSLIVTSVPLPMLIQSGGLEWLRRNAQASAKSSTCKNSRRGVPVPQTITSSLPASLAS